MIVGDFRHGGVFEAFTGIQDNKSVLGVLHSLGPRHTLERLMQIAKESPFYDEETFYQGIRTASLLIVHTERTEDGKIRVKNVSQVSNIVGPSEYTVEPIFKWIATKGLIRTDVPLSTILCDKMGKR